MKQIKGTHQTPYAMLKSQLFFSSIYGVQNIFSVLNYFRNIKTQ